MTGRLVGRHPLAPGISPRKTIEGAVAGLGAALVCSLIVWPPGSSGPASPWAPVVGVALNLANQVGDLLESALKRARGVKDSGRALGGHGGFLDCLDGLLLAAPFAYLARLALS